jgi:hypothetical protein
MNFGFFFFFLFISMRALRAGQAEGDGWIEICLAF